MERLVGGLTFDLVNRNQWFKPDADVWQANPQARLPIPFAQFSAANESVLADDAQDRSSHPSLMGLTNAYWSLEQDESAPLTNY